MAKKEETISLIDTFSEFKELKNIDRTTMVSVLEESFRSVIAKMFGTDENYDVIVNPDKGDFEIWRNREVVADEDLTNPNMQISLTEAQKIDASYEVGEEVTDEVIFAKFGRRAILNLRQTLASKILELEKDSLYNKYIDRVGTVISAEVYQIWKKEMLLLDDEGNELLLPKTEQIPSDFYRKGETARAVVARVDNKNNNPKIILSRTSPVFLQRLFEMEVPEINDGLITIKKIARIPGERAKIAVESYDDRIDPVGACVGVKGSRIHGIVRELRNENIDVTAEILFQPFPVPGLFLIAYPVFHAGPKIHGHGPKLHLHRKIFHGVQKIHRYSQNYVIAPVSVGLGISDIILFLDYHQVRLFFQRGRQIINVLHKITDNPQSRYVLEMVPGIGHSRRKSKTGQL